MSLSLRCDGAIAHLIIDRPEKRNAFSNAMWAALPGLVADAMVRTETRVLMLEAAVPGVFCAGADIGELARPADGDVGLVRAAQLSLANAPKPVIAVIEGDCIGGGCGLALACDIRVAGPAARFGLPPARLGLVYSLHDTKLLVDLVGPGQAKRMLFGAEPIDAAEAHRIGLVEMLAAETRDAARQLATTIAGNSAHSVAGSKRIIQRILDGQADDDLATLAMFAQAFAGPDFAEGVAAFGARRRPSFG